MVATAYSSDPRDNQGGGNITATGQNLLANPMAIAVDPNVIPLGTKLHVEGYGIAYAVDTGGAIKGNIIDIHFPTYEQCVSWGRRTVTVTILSWGDTLKAVFNVVLGVDVDYALSTDEGRQVMIKMLQMETKLEVNDDNLNEVFINYLNEKIIKSLPKGFIVYHSHGVYRNSEQEIGIPIKSISNNIDEDVEVKSPQENAEDSDYNSLNLSEVFEDLENNIDILIENDTNTNVQNIELNEKLMAYISEYEPQFLERMDVLELSQDSDQDSIAYIINVIVDGKVDKIVGGF